MSVFIGESAVAREVDMPFIGVSTAYASFTQPTLTADGTLGGNSFAVSASNVYTGYEAYKAFGSNASAVYSSAVNPSAQTIYYTIYNPNPIRITKLTFTNVPSPLTSSSPSAGSIQRSSDGVTWTTITSFTNSNNTNGSTWSVSLTNSGFYNYYRIVITGANTTQAYVNIGKIQITASQTISGSVAREVDAGYVGVSGVAREFWKSASAILGEASIGDTVYMNVNGISTEFIVVNQGLPSSVYDSSCNGTWLLMKDIYGVRVWDSSNNDYANSDIHSYLNNTFVNLFDSDIKSVIKQVKLPYTNGTGSGGSLATGSSGISAKVFLLSYAEVMDGTRTYANAEGAVLSHFDGAADSDRIAYVSGSACSWWLRSPRTGNTSSAWYVYISGAAYYYDVTVQNGVRPALILPSDILVDENFNVIA